MPTGLGSRPIFSCPHFSRRPSKRLRPPTPALGRVPGAGLNGVQGVAAWYNPLPPKGFRSSMRVSVGTWRSLVAYLNGVQGVAGSNPAVPTTSLPRQRNALACRAVARVLRIRTRDEGPEPSAEAPERNQAGSARPTRRARSPDGRETVGRARSNPAVPTIDESSASAARNPRIAQSALPRLAGGTIPFILRDSTIWP